MKLFTLALAAALLTAIPVCAQEPLETPSQPRFRSGVDLVQLFVTVLDEAGDPVRGLTHDDFELVEDGTPQEIAAFDVVDIRDEPAGRPAPIPSDVATNVGRSQRRLFVLVLDDLHIEPALSPRVRQHARMFIDEYVGPSDLVMLAPTGGDTAFFQEFTSDKARLGRVLDRFIGGMTSFPARAGPERTYFAQATLDVVAGLGKHLAAADRRVAMVVFTQGFPLETFLTEPVSGTPGSVVHAFRQAVDELAAANVSVYLVDPAGLSLGRPQNLEEMRGLADETGGFAAVARNDYGEVFRRIIQAASSYYLLGYTAGADGRARREVKVRVPGRDVRIRVRRYVSAADARAPASDAGSDGQPAGLRQALNSPVPLDGLGLRMQVIPFRRSGSPTATFVLEVDGKDLAIAADGDHSPDRLHVVLGVLDSRGREKHTISTVIDLTGDERVPTGEPPLGVRWIWSTFTEPGRYVVRAAVASTGTGRVGLVVGDYVVPPVERKRMAMSGVALTWPGAARFLTRTASGADPGRLTGALPPATVRLFERGQTVAVVVEVYPPEDRRSDLLVTAEVRQEGREDPLLVRRERVDGTSPDAAAIRFELPTDSLPPGPYTLRLAGTVRGGRDRDEVERVVGFEIVESTTH